MLNKQFITNLPPQEDRATQLNPELYTSATVAGQPTLGISTYLPCLMSTRITSRLPYPPRIYVDAHTCTAKAILAELSPIPTTPTPVTHH